MNQTRIFISSTCYDLSQVRADLFEFIVSLGHKPVLSEFNTFPIDPDKNTIDNCIENVKNNADIFVLIIGNRYGSISDDGRSITNTEYIYAKEIGIPIYVFINRPIKTLLEVWKNNKDANFSSTVDSTKIFEFVRCILEDDKKWCFDFEKAQEIIETLKIQLAHLLKDSLSFKRKFTKDGEFTSLLNRLSATAINLLVTKPELYELRFFAQSLRDELLKFQELKHDFDYQVVFSSNKRIDNPDELSNWLSQEIHSVKNFLATVKTLVDNAFPFFYGVPGIPSDIKGLYYVANSLARLYKEMILWSLNVKATSVVDEFVPIRDCLSNYIKIFAQEIWESPETLRTKVESVLQKKQLGEKSTTLTVTLNISIDKDTSDKFQQEMEKLTTRIRQRS